MSRNSINSALIVASQYPPVTGGAESMAKSLAGRFAASGVKTTVLTKTAPGLPAESDEAGVRVIRLAAGPLFYARLSYRIWKLRGEYEAMHNFLLSSITIICLAWGKLLGKKVIVSVGGSGACGGFYDTTGMGRFAAIKRRVILLLNPVFACPSETSRREFIYNGVPPASVARIPNPVDAALFYPPDAAARTAARAALKLSGQVFLFVGRLVPEKGLARLLQAWAAARAHCAGAALVIVGSGPQAAELKELAEKNDAAGSVIFAGRAAELPPYYHAADFFVLPSYTEGMSIALLEALACGLPAITTDVSGTEMIIERETGFKVPSGTDAAGLAQALAKACALRPEERNRMAQNARRAITANYSLDIIAKEYLRLYSA